uniref:EOG090X0AQH n=1 Tax=Ceriodaphnia reticulata TaxID=302197 RepID=A0A4Y7M087_9CRUS|nr:EOG090X0AQH [Ceriodaphnia reticulata]SVE73109.1 EOG090X0AQH [Ceriodaphnia reticulata]
MDKADESSDVMPVTSLDDEQQTTQSTQREEYGSPNNLISGLIQVSHATDGYSPARQLESSLNESVNDSYAPSEGLMKVPQLESTRISTTCAPEDFDPGADLSKVQSESGDSQNPLNAGFVKPDNTNQSSSKLTSSENSVFVESDSETGQSQQLESEDNIPAATAEDPNMDLNVSVTSENEDLCEEEKNTSVSATASNQAQQADQFNIQQGVNLSETTNSDPEVEQLMKLPETVTQLTSKDGVKVFLVGTAHFSQESQEDVAKTILMTRPRVVVVELCVSRLNILRFDEKTILEEAKNLNMEKVRSTIKQYGAVQGALYLLFLSTSAHLTRQLGMAPGGEFRRAYHEARNVPGCRIHLGDRPIHVTLHRALAALSLWQKAKLVWHLLLSRGPISAEEVERCKQKDLLEEMLEEMTGEFPPLSRVFVQERDLCLAHSMQLAAADAAKEARSNTQLTEPPTVVGVVGIGHVAGISRYFEKVSESDVKKVMSVPPQTAASRFLVVSLKLSLACLVGYGCYKVIPKTLGYFQCGAQCANRLVQKGPHSGLQLMDAGPKGTGLRCDVQLARGTFVCEYAGEVIGAEEARRRYGAQKESGRPNYIFALREHFGTDDASVLTYIDPTYIGNVGRYINHSCDPNLLIVPVRTDTAVPKLCLFARRNIPAGAELTFDYGGGVEPLQGVPDGWSDGTACRCNSSVCRRVLPFDYSLG